MYFFHAMFSCNSVFYFSGPVLEKTLDLDSLSRKHYPNLCKSLPDKTNYIQEKWMINVSSLDLYRETSMILMAWTLLAGY